MKLHIDFKKDEAQAYKNFEQMFKPESISSLDFAKALFLAGMSSIQTQAIEAAQKQAQEDAEKAKEESTEDQEIIKVNPASELADEIRQEN